MSEAAEGPAMDAVARPALDADAIAAVVGALATVRLSVRSTVATYLPGRRVPGVRTGDGRTEVHVALVYPTTATEGSTAVRVALAGVVDGPVDVVVDDVLTADELGPEPRLPERLDNDLPEVGHA